MVIFAIIKLQAALYKVHKLQKAVCAVCGGSGIKEEKPLKKI